MTLSAVFIRRLCDNRKLPFFPLCWVFNCSINNKMVLPIHNAESKIDVSQQPQVAVGSVYLHLSGQLCFSRPQVKLLP